MPDTVRSFFAPPISVYSADSTAKLIWLVRVRWLALGAQLLSIPPALAFQMLEMRMLPMYASVIGALAAVNGVTWLWLRRGESATQSQVLLQLFADIAAVSLLLSLSGGAWNPLVPILFVHSVLGAMLLEGRLSFIFFGLLLLCLTLVQANLYIPPGLEGALLPAVILFPAQFLVALVFWILAAWLSRRLDSLQSQFLQASERQTRIDRLRAVGALAAGLSHEFATPLNTTQLRLSRLARSHDLEGDPDLVTAREELHRCGEILRNMAGSQLDPERLSLEVADVDHLASQVCSSFSKVNSETPLRCHVEGKRPLRALLPSVAFSQALINLIDNAIESSPERSPVDVTVRANGANVELSVADRGNGWPAMVKSHLGEPFITTKPEGVGLGLYYVHSLLEAIGASLTLDDRKGGGAMVRISMPSVGDGKSGGLEARE